jgi:uncharacterized protein DUF4845
MYKQRGMTFIGLVLIIAGVVFIATVGIKLYPSYMEFMTVKKAISRIGSQPGFAEMAPRDIKDSFDKSASIDNITAISSDDLVIAKGEGKPVVSVQYQAVVPIVANVSALLDFFASTDSKATPESTAASDAGAAAK